jgi:hypothetical protein
MMRKIRPTHLVLIGFLGVLAGVLIPLGIVVKILPSTFFLNFLAYTLSVAGLALGVVGTAWQTRIDRDERGDR